MIPSRNNKDDNDEPDIIDLTESNGYHESMYFRIRAPSPFADEPARTRMLSTPAETLTNETAENLLCSPSHPTNTLRQTFNKLFRRNKSNNHKKAVSTTTNDINSRYNFNTGPTNHSHSSISRGNSTNKRVHWIDDNDMILNASHHFLENLKSFVAIVIQDTRIDDDYLKQCQISFNEFDELVNCKQIKVAFDHLIQFANRFEKDQLYEQQTCIEKTISQMIVFSSE